MRLLSYSPDLIRQSANVARFLLEMTAETLDMDEGLHRDQITFARYQAAKEAYLARVDKLQSNEFIDDDGLDSKAEIQVNNISNLEAVYLMRQKMTHGRIVLANPANAYHALGSLTRGRSGSAEECLGYNTSLLFDIFGVLKDSGFEARADEVLRLYFDQLYNPETGVFDKAIDDDAWLTMGDTIRDALCENEQAFNLYASDRASLHQNAIFFKSEETYRIKNREYAVIPAFSDEAANEIVVADIISVAALNLNLTHGIATNKTMTARSYTGIGSTEVERVSKEKAKAMVHVAKLDMANHFIACGLGIGAFNNDADLMVRVQLEAFNEAQTPCTIEFAILSFGSERKRLALFEKACALDSLENKNQSGATEYGIYLTTEALALPSQQRNMRPRLHKAASANAKIAYIIDVNPKLIPYSGAFKMMNGDRDFHRSLQSIEPSEAVEAEYASAEEANPSLKRVQNAKMVFEESVLLHETERAAYFGISTRDTRPDTWKLSTTKFFYSDMKAFTADSNAQALASLTAAYQDAFEQAIEAGADTIKFNLIGTEEAGLLDDESMSCVIDAISALNLEDLAYPVAFVATGLTRAQAMELSEEVDIEIKSSKSCVIS